jgi:hypothetical protein
MQGTPPPAHAGRTRLLFFGGAVGAAVVALAVTLLVGRRGDGPRGALPVVHGATIAIHSTPEGAEVFAGTVLVGTTPLTWHPHDSGALGIELRKPGYRDARREFKLTPELAIDVPLEPIEAYEGVWKIPSGELRRFEFAGDFIEGYALTAVDDVHPRFLRRFEYVEQDHERLRFAASEPHLERAAPDEPSCRFPLATEYRFDLAHDILEQRRQRVAYELRGGRCVAPPGGQLTPEWTGWEACERLAHGDRSTVAESSAGVGSLQPDLRKPATTRSKAKPIGKKAAIPADVADDMGKNVIDYGSQSAVDYGGKSAGNAGDALQQRDLDQRAKESTQAPQAQQAPPPVPAKGAPSQKKSKQAN